MYSPPAFKDADVDSVRRTIESAHIANFVTASSDGPMVTPLPFILDDRYGKWVLIGHMARANPHWRSTPIGLGLAIFMGPDAYVSPSWYPTKQETAKVLPTWNYVTVHVHGQVEYFEDQDRLLDAVTRLTRRHEEQRVQPWAVSDAPESFVSANLRGIIGIQLTVERVEGKRKLSQNRSEQDRLGVIAALSNSENATDRDVARHMREQGSP